MFETIHAGNATGIIQKLHAEQWPWTVWIRIPSGEPGSGMPAVLDHLELISDAYAEADSWLAERFPTDRYLRTGPCVSFKDENPAFEFKIRFG